MTVLLVNLPMDQKHRTLRWLSWQLQGCAFFCLHYFLIEGGISLTLAKSRSVGHGDDVWFYNDFIVFRIYKLHRPKSSNCSSVMQRRYWLKHTFWSWGQLARVESVLPKDTNHKLMIPMPPCLVFLSGSCWNHDESMNHGCGAWDPQDKQDKNNRSGLLKEVMCHGLWARHQDMALEGLGKSVMVGCLKQQNVSFKVHFFLWFVNGCVW